jgi:Mycothiol maleylpyruvate isomerase N-terminal domain.
MIRDAYLETAAVAVTLLREPVVAERWAEPSALAEFSVGGLAAHLASQVTRAGVPLEEPGAGDPIDVLDHYRRSAWVDGDIHSEVNTGIRERSEGLAGSGPAAVADAADAALDRLRTVLPAEPADRVVHLLWAGWSLTLDDFLLTRTMEIVVHSDDLAVSVGLPTPELPTEATDATVRLLAAVAARRHGPIALVRALSRAERAPESITAF